MRLCFHYTLHILNFFAYTLYAVNQTYGAHWDEVSKQDFPISKLSFSR